MNSRFKVSPTREENHLGQEQPLLNKEVSNHGFKVNLMSLKFCDRRKAVTVTEQDSFIIYKDFIPIRIYLLNINERACWLNNQDVTARNCSGKSGLGVRDYPF